MQNIKKCINISSWSMASDADNLMGFHFTMVHSNRLVICSFPQHGPLKHPILQKKWVGLGWGFFAFWGFMFVCYKIWHKIRDGQFKFWKLTKRCFEKPALNSLFYLKQCRCQVVDHIINWLRCTCTCWCSTWSFSF